MPKYNKKRKSTDSTGQVVKSKSTGNASNGKKGLKARLGSGILCNRQVISTPTPTYPSSPTLLPPPDTSSPGPSGVNNVSYELSSFGEDMDEDGDTFSVNIQHGSVADNSMFDNHQQTWAAQLPCFDGSQHQRKHQAWPKWRAEILPTIYKIFLETESKLYHRIPLQTPPGPQPNEEVICTVPGCGNRKVTTHIECVERTGMFMLALPC
ncbi:hypothetical protein M422DRAFT_54964 [Sphaerobolus stellatus SS14]|uniref:Uncharacterized protein n=1 Tax=Sphaerobolus stellatus (strain SS14) TaxID=990650 RepID=A0A0C9UQ93_SPHS4|nr:hypothetical protein M422DRAFT_54964 [Sphaerobolus stellatus SS14]